VAGSQLHSLVRPAASPPLNRRQGARSCPKSDARQVAARRTPGWEFRASSSPSRACGTPNAAAHPPNLPVPVNQNPCTLQRPPRATAATPRSRPVAAGGAAANEASVWRCAPAMRTTAAHRTRATRACLTEVACGRERAARRSRVAGSVRRRCRRARWSEKCLDYL